MTKEKPIKMKDVKLNIKQRLLNARKSIAETTIKKQGNNPFSKYGYFTPSQITSLVTKVCVENGIITIYSADETQAVLRIENIESDDFVEFKMPVSVPEIKATNGMQKLGGLTTYSNRYLEMLAFGITDNNLDFDSQDNRPKANTTPTLPLLKIGSADFKNCLAAISKGYTINQVETRFRVTEEVKAELIKHSI